ncbi:MAG TPA: sugar phosphate isomerase/epimerase family protein [Candidatus Hydrogenedentes bacterium]|nr:sugar phosphate isomerase/epimerase family protein [Candidatus Hydrogenedentota bacterium]HPG69323.1 sugar phosphate isomerase/epimerase family protein [Candidatus Hydrogenedentota bacterium]
MFEDRIAFLAGLGFSSMPADKVVSELKALGYAAVEWTLAHFNPRGQTAAERQAVVDMTHQGGLAVSELVVQQDYVCKDDKAREDRVALTLECIDACAEAGITTVNLFTGPAPWDPQAPKVPSDISHGMAWDMIIDSFDRIVSALERRKVHGAVEGVWGHLCNDYFTTRPLIDHYNSPFLGVNFDPSHGVLKGNFDTGWIVRHWGKDAIKHVHLKDAIGIPEDGRFLFPFLGEGRVDWKGMFSALAELGYEGYLSIEFESFTYHRQVLHGNTVEAARRSIADAKALMAL